MQVQPAQMELLDRRGALVLLAASVWPVESHSEDSAALLRGGGCVLLLRHASTMPGVGDPPEFRLGVCSTQRNLSTKGQAEARHIGTWFRRHTLEPRTVLTSAWCRCIDTAQLAFGRHTSWPALNSSFGDRYPATDATPSLRESLQAVPKGQFEVWITHQVNITAITGAVPAPAEGFVLDAEAKLRARTLFDG